MLLPVANRFTTKQIQRNYFTWKANIITIYKVDHKFSHRGTCINHLKERITSAITSSTTSTALILVHQQWETH